MPERPAVAGAGGCLSQRQLASHANRIAHHLRALGVGRNTPVGLCMDRTPEMVTALLGILKSGGAYLPLNYEHPAGRLSHQLEEAGAQASEALGRAIVQIRAALTEGV